jgi:hypothetical protein
MAMFTSSVKKRGDAAQFFGAFFFILLPVFLGLSVGNLRAQTQPANTLSILTYGAGTNLADNTTFIQNCINAAQTAGKGVWIPAGIYTNTGSLHATGILIAGAGMSNSVIYRQQNSSDITATELSLLSCNVQDLGIDGNGTSRGVNASYGINMKGVGWLIQRVQVHHADAGMWLSGSSGTVQDSRMLQTFADGININNAGADANRAGANLTIQNCFQDGAGDDGFAINSQGEDVGWPNMANPKVVNCTSFDAFYANGIRMAGGSNSLVQSCLVSNTTHECGIESSSFGSGGYFITNGLITGNLVYGSGTADEASCLKSGDARTVATYSYNTLINSSHYGFQIGTPTYPNAGNIVFGPSNIIINPTLSGIHVQSGVVGSGLIITNTVMNLNSGQLPFVNGSSSFTATLLGNSWQGLATNITTSVSEASGQNWTTGSYWSSGLAPGAGNLYEALSGATLRPPQTASSAGSPLVFGGDSLQIDAGANIRFKSSGAPTAGFFTFSGIGNALILNGGWLGNGDDFTATINSPIKVTAATGIYGGVDATTANDLVGGVRKGFRNYIFKGGLSGSNNLTLGNAVLYNNPAVTVGVGVTPNFAFVTNGAYTGNITVTAGWLQAGTAGALGTGNLTLAGGSAGSGVGGPAMFDALVALSSPGTLTVQNVNNTLLLDNNLAFGSVVIDGVTLTNGVYTAAQINAKTGQTNVVDATELKTLTVGPVGPVLSPQTAGTNLVLNWSYAGAVTLQSATNVAGPWAPVAGASPYTNAILPQVPAVFFKLQ